MAIFSAQALITPISKLSSTSRDEDPLSNDHEQSRSMQNLSLQLFKIEAPIEISVYDMIVNVEKLGNRLDQLETYFTIYGYFNIQKITFAHLKLSSHELIHRK